MPDNVGISTGTGAVVAAEDIGSVEYQRIKLVAGDISATTPIGATSGVPGASSAGLIVNVKPGVSVSAQVSGTITIAPTTFTVNTAPTVAGASVTIQQGASVDARVSGTVTIAPTIFTVNTGLNTTVISGTVSIVNGASVAAAVSGTLTVNTAPTIAGASITIQQGVSVGIAASITGTTAGANQALQGSTASLASGVFGLIVRVADSAAVSGTITISPTTFTVNTVANGLSVDARVSGTVTIAPTILTVNTVANGLSVDARVSGTVTISPTTFTVNTGLNTTVISGTVSVSNLTSVVSGTISVSNLTTVVSGTIGIAVSITGTTAGANQALQGSTASLASGVFGLIVRVADSAAISGTITIAPTVLTVNTGLNTTILTVNTVANGLSVDARVSGTVTIAPTTFTVNTGLNTTVVSGTISVSNLTTVVSGTIGIAVSITGTTAGANQALQGSTASLASGVFGLIVRVADSAAISGTITIAPTVLTVNTGLNTTILTVNTVGNGLSVDARVSGTVTIAPTTLTVNTGLNTTVVSGTVTVSNLGVMPTVLATTGQVTGTTATGQVVWIAGGQVGATNAVWVTGSSVSVVVSGTVALNNQTTVVSGTIAINNQTTVVSGTITVSNVVIAQLTGTTAVPSISATGGIVWLAGGQSTTAFPVVITGTVTAGAGTTVVSGTLTAIPIDRTTAVPSAAATGGIMWIAGGQSTTAFPVVITGTVTAGAGTTVVSGTLTAIPVDRTTATPAAAASGGIVWVANPGAAVATTVITVNTILNTALVSVAGGTTVVSGTVSVSNIISATGVLVSILSTGTVSVSNFLTVVSGTVTIATGTVVAAEPGYTAVAFSYTTAVANTTRFQPAFDIALNLTTVAGTTQFVVPNGKVLRLLAINAVVVNTVASVAIARARIYVMASTGAFTTTAPIIAAAYVGAITSATTQMGMVAMPLGGGLDIPAGATVQINYSVTGASSQPLEFVVMGALIP